MNRKWMQPVLLTPAKYLILIIICIFLDAPIFILVSNAFKTEAEINQIIPNIIPMHATFDNFKELAQPGEDFFITLWNSVKIAIITMVLSMIAALPAGYALSRIKSKSSKFVLGWILMSQMFPLITIIVPLILILQTMHLTNTHLGLIIVYSVWSLPFGIWMLKGFIDGIPNELDEASFIDGCSYRQMFTYVLFPVLLPGIMTAGIFSFINAMNEYFFALVLIKSPVLQTVMIKLSSYIGLSGYSRNGVLAAGALLSTLPIMILFMFLQKYFVKGLTTGSGK